VTRSEGWGPGLRLFAHSLPVHLRPGPVSVRSQCTGTEASAREYLRTVYRRLRPGPVTVYS